MLFKIEHKIELAKQEIEHVSSFTKLIDVDSALNELDALKTSITESLLRVRTKSEEVIGNIRLQEPMEPAAQDIEKLRHAIHSVTVELESFQAEISSRLEKHRRLCVFREDIERIDSDLRDLNEQLKTIDGRIGENLSASRTTLAAFEQFEQTITVSYTFHNLLKVNFSFFIIIYYMALLAAVFCKICIKRKFLFS